MADRATWAKRVEEWRASGLSSEAFCVGRGYTPGGLRNAAHLVESEARSRKAPAVRVARVLRVAQPAAVAAPVEEPESAILVELGGARVAVTRGFDRGALAAVLDVLAARGGAS